MKWTRRAKERGEKERVEIEKGERGRERERKGGLVKREERARLTARMAEGQTGKKKEDVAWQGGEVKLDTKSSKKN